MSSPRLVVFDMDGTLIDSQAIIIAAMRRAFGQMGRPEPADTAILSVVGLSLEEVVHSLAPDLDEKAVAEGARFYRDSFVRMRAEQGGEAGSPLYPGAKAALERLHAEPETLLGVATGKARRGLEHVFDAHNIGGFFHTCQTADGHPSKPHPSMLERALSETGCDAARAVMIGDTDFDMQMGKAAGFTTIAVTWGYHSVTRLMASKPDYLINDFSDLDAVLEHIWGHSDEYST